MPVVSLKRWGLLVFYSFCLAAKAQSPYNFLLHKTYAERFYALDSIFRSGPLAKDSIALFRELDKLAALAGQEKDEELAIEAPLIRCLHRLHKVYRNTKPYERELLALMKQAEELKSVQLKIRIQNCLGFYYRERTSNYGASIEAYLQAYQLIRHLPVTVLPDKINYVYNDLSAMYYYLGDYNNAKQLLREVDTVPVYPRNFFGKTRLRINQSNTLALIYRKTGRYDSAEFFFKKAHRIALEEKDSVWVGIAGGNIGITYFLQHRYAEAIPLLEEDVRLSILGNEKGNAANSLLKLAAISLEIGNIPKAREQLSRSRSLVKRGSQNYQHLAEYYPLMARLAALERNNELAYRYSDSSLVAKDSIQVQEHAVLLARAQQKIDIESHKLEVQGLENQQKMQMVVRNWLLSILGMLAAIILLLVSRQRLLKRQRHFAEQQRIQAQNELVGARQQLQSFTTSIREKNELIDRLTNEMEIRQTPLDEDAIGFRQETIAQLRHSTILTEDEWTAFRTNFEKVYPEWFGDIRKKLPGLSAADLRFLTLTKLQFNAREMAAVLGISPSSLRMSRHRLRKKYHLSEEESIELLAEGL
ncbi:MAG: tetratricopeptide repeat protein [Bacteroidota bacterium]